MKAIPIILCLAISVTMTVCDTGKDRMELKQGMTESQVESKYGTPDSVIKDSYANNGRNKTVEYLRKDRKVTIDYHQSEKDGPLKVVYWKTELLTASVNTSTQTEHEDPNQPTDAGD